MLWGARCQAAHSCPQTHLVLQHPLRKILHKSIIAAFFKNQSWFEAWRLTGTWFVHRTNMYYWNNITFNAEHLASKGEGKSALLSENSICLLIKAQRFTLKMFGSKLKGMRDSLTREITCIPCPGKIGQQPQTFSVLRNLRNGPRE